MTVKMYCFVWVVIALVAVAAGVSFAGEIPPYGQKAWEDAIANGLIVGYGDGTYGPTDPASRQDSLEMAQRQAERAVEEHEQNTTPPVAGNTPPTQTLGGENTPVNKPAQGDGTMMVLAIAGLVALAFIGVALGVGMFRNPNAPAAPRTANPDFSRATAVLSEVLAFAAGEARGSASTPEASVAFRVDGFDKKAQQAQAQAALAAAQAQLIAAQAAAQQLAAQANPPANGN